MKKWIILIVVVVIIGGVWYYLRTYYPPYVPIWYQPKFGLVSEGDIRVPITAAGLIEPNERIEVKSKASGEVQDRPVEEGDYVHEDETLLKLDPDDEKRNRDAAQAELDRATALLAQAEASRERAKANITAAEADIERLVAQCRMSQFDLEKARSGEKGAYSEEELLRYEVQHEVNVAQKRAAEAQRDAARAALEEAEQTIALQKAVVRVTQTKLEEAQERLDETTIKSQYDALVTDVRVRKSEMIQSGTASLTGGTVVMYLADVSKKKVIARVDESDYGRVLNISPIDALPETPGLQEAAAAGAAEMKERSGKVRLTVDAFPEDEFEGVIERVEPQGRLNQGSAIIQYNVHVWITDKNASKLPLGAQAQVEFTVESATNTLRVPAEAVKNNQGQRGVWIKVDPEPGSNEQWGKKFIPCRFGITDGEYTQVIAVEGENELTVGTTIYTKLPRTPEEEE